MAVARAPVGRRRGQPGDGPERTGQRSPMGSQPALGMKFIANGFILGAAASASASGAASVTGGDEVSSVSSHDSGASDAILLTALASDKAVGEWDHGTEPAGRGRVGCRHDGGGGVDQH